MNAVVGKLSQMYLFFKELEYEMTYIFFKKSQVNILWTDRNIIL